MLVVIKHLILLPGLSRGLKQLGILITYSLEVCWQATETLFFLLVVFSGTYGLLYWEEQPGPP